MAKSETSLEVVCDAGPLIHLDELDCLDLLSDFRAVYVPEQVWQEVEQHRPGALSQPAVTLRKVAVQVPTSATFTALAGSLALASGEQAALALMEHYPEAILLTDDAAARLAAATLGYQVHGSIGILLRAVRRGHRSREHVLGILAHLHEQSTLYIRPALLQEIISQLEHFE
jgi:predicted nucleic acid-binding protein